MAGVTQVTRLMERGLSLSLSPLPLSFSSNMLVTADLRGSLDYFKKESAKKNKDPPTVMLINLSQTRCEQAEAS